MDQEQEKMRSLMMDHIDGNLTGELSKYVENHISKSEEASKEYEQLKQVMTLLKQEEELEPDPKGRDHFLEMERPQDLSKPISGNRDES